MPASSRSVNRYPVSQINSRKVKLMRGCVPRGLCGVLFCCLFLFSAQSIGQNQNQDQNQNPKPDASTAAPPAPTLDADDDTDSPDVPIFLKGLIDTEQYLK